MLDHLALQAGNIDGEEGPGHQHEGVQGEQARLNAPYARDHDLSHRQLVKIVSILGGY